MNQRVERLVQTELHQMLAKHRLHLDGFGGEDGLGDHVVGHGCHGHIIIKQTEGNRSRLGNGWDSGGK